MPRPVDLRLYAVLDPALGADRDPVRLLEAACRGGATLVQLRDKRYGAREVVALARRLKEVAARFGVPLVVNDRVDVALAAEAFGVHLGEEDMEPQDARRLLGDGPRIGVTVHLPEEARRVDAAVVDYAGVGPVFPTRSKQQTVPVLGVEGLARLVGELRRRAPGLAVCAISGITPDNAAACIAAGCDGVAVIQALFAAPDPEAAARALRRAVEEALERRRSGG